MQNISKSFQNNSVADSRKTFNGVLSTSIGLPKQSLMARVQQMNHSMFESMNVRTRDGNRKSQETINSVTSKSHLPTQAETISMPPLPQIPTSSEAKNTSQGKQPQSTESLTH